MPLMEDTKIPNWCLNYVQVVGSRESIEALAEAAIAGKFCSHVKPVPTELVETIAGSYAEPDEQAALAQQEQANLDKYGYTNWYDFCVAEWGTKWDVGGTDSHVEVMEDPEAGNWLLNFSFDSAWSPPTEIYENMAEAGYDIEAYYYEPSEAFCGKFTNADGDEYYKILGDSDWVVKNIPEDIDENMNISESLACWEDDNDDFEDSEDNDVTEELSETPE